MMPSPATATVLDHARPLVDAGLHVLLLRGKLPASEHAYLDATTDMDRLAELAAASPDATNVGVAPGRSGLLVLDLDETKQVEKVPALIRLQAVAAQHGGLPETLTVRTGSGGRHLYFHAHPTRVLPQGNGVRHPETGKTESGVDFRGVKGYVVAPPSIHPVTNRAYVWETPSGRFEPERVAELPDWLMDFLAPPRLRIAAPEWTPPEMPPTVLEQKRVSGLVQSACDELARMTEGQGRRSELQRAAYRLGGLLWTGFPVESLRGSLQSAAHACGHYDEDTRRCIDDAIRDGMAKPYPLPPDSSEYISRVGWKERIAAALRTWAMAYRKDDEDEDGHVVTEEERKMAAPLVLKVPGAGVWFLRTLENDYTAVDGNLLRTDLERLYPEIETTYVTDEKKTKQMTAPLLYARYGRRADSLIYDMSASSSGYRPGPSGGGELVLRCCELDPMLEPAYDHQVHAWLERMGGGRINLLLDWLSVLTMLDRPVAALYLHGPGGSGKGMLAAACSRLFGRARTSYDDVVVGQFNSALRACPVVHLDERAPESSNGSAGFRSLIGESERPLTEKYRPAATLRGCPRLIITSNGLDALRLSEEGELTHEDEEAIARRIVYIRIPEDAPEHLRSIGGRATTDEWVSTHDGAPGAIPNHLAWLVENWTMVHQGKRFLVEGDSADWFKQIGMRTGLAQAIVFAIARHASAGVQGNAYPQSVVDRPPVYYVGSLHSTDGKSRPLALVSNQNLREHWPWLTGDQRVPSHRAVSAALQKLTMGQEAKHYTVAKDLRIRLSEVSAEVVLEMAEQMTDYDTELVQGRWK